MGNENLKAMKGKKSIKVRWSFNFIKHLSIIEEARDDPLASSSLFMFPRPFAGMLLY